MQKQGGRPAPRESDSDSPPAPKAGGSSFAFPGPRTGATFSDADQPPKPRAAKPEVEQPPKASATDQRKQEPPASAKPQAIRDPVKPSQIAETRKQWQPEPMQAIGNPGADSDESSEGGRPGGAFPSVKPQPAPAVSKQATYEIEAVVSDSDGFADIESPLKLANESIASDVFSQSAIQKPAPQEQTVVEVADTFSDSFDSQPELPKPVSANESQAVVFDLVDEEEEEEQEPLPASDDERIPDLGASPAKAGANSSPAWDDDDIPDLGQSPAKATRVSSASGADDIPDVGDGPAIVEVNEEFDDESFETDPPRRDPFAAIPMDAHGGAHPPSPAESPVDVDFDDMDIDIGDFQLD